MDRRLLTAVGRDRLQNELSQLRKVELPASVTAIEEARAHGDLSENAEYHAAKERNAIISAKIAEIKMELAMSEVIDPAARSVRQGGLRLHGDPLRPGQR